jgi:ABC-type nitrate/sulfonate/bicarbonate transport system substrate-binding protein
MKLRAMMIPAALLCWISIAMRQEKVIVGHSARAALSIGPPLYGIERGFYRDEGIDLVYVSLRADLGIKALLSGDIDYSYGTGTIIRGAIIGVPVRNLSFDFSRVLHALMSRPEIPNAALRGKKVGVSSFGATGDLATRVGLRSLGLDPEKDVTIMTLGSDTLRHAALVAETVQATHTPVPLNIQLKKTAIMSLSMPAIFCSVHSRVWRRAWRKNQEESRPSPANGARLLACHARFESRASRFHFVRAKKVRLFERCHGRGLQVSY